MEFTSIEIDINVHRHLENSRQNFNETPNDILCRILEIREANPKPRPSNPSQFSKNKSWLDKGISLPDLTELKMSYRGVEHWAQINDGKIVIGKDQFSSLSDAAGHVAITKKGTSPSLNGWMYWHVDLDNSGNWVLLDTLRANA